MESIFKKKYEYVAKQIGDATGTILDVGARDRVLERYLVLDNLRYLSADVVPGHDYIVDLEHPLQFDDNTFEFVVALDVLEHLEFAHRALDELIRITKNCLFVSLPNMSCLSFRLQYFLHGKLSGKYSLTPEFLSDRHRWLTTFHQSVEFVNVIASKNGCSVKPFYVYEEPRQSFGKFGVLVPHKILPEHLRAYTMVFEIKKRA